MADTYKTIKCPACGVTMKKIFIPSAGVSIDICNEGCGGIFFDNQELNYFKDASNNMSEIKELLNGKNFPHVDQNEIRVCPACSSQMVKNTFGGIKNLEIDSCYSCGGIFLDNGELDIIRNCFVNRKEAARNTKITTSSPKPADFNLQQFYKEAQIEQFKNNINIQSRQFHRTFNTSLTLLNLLFKILTRL